MNSAGLLSASCAKASVAGALVKINQRSRSGYCYCVVMG